MTDSTHILECLSWLTSRNSDLSDFLGFSYLVGEGGGIIGVLSVAWDWKLHDVGGLGDEALLYFINLILLLIKVTEHVIFGDHRYALGYLLR